MANRKEGRALPPQISARFYFSPPLSPFPKKYRRLQHSGIFLVFGSLLVAGCGAPGEPTPPAPQIPRAVADLAAQQTGEAVQLSFTMPTKTIRGEALIDTPAVEILRGAVKTDGSADPKSFHEVQTVPGALVENYRAEDQIRIADTVPAEELRSGQGRIAYRVRTRASRRHTSADSNTVIVRIVPAAERIRSVQAVATETAVELSWTPPTRTFEGEPLPNITEYHVYRGEIEPASADAAGKDLSQAKWKSPLSLLGHSATPSYRDTDFRFGVTYIYTVRTVAPADGTPIESSDSVPAIITLQDIYPPSVPQDLVAAVIVGEPTGQPEVDLSWSISPETDLAGYHVYRSEQEETHGELVTPDLLLSPAYRDTSVQAGHRYWYRVTAVDRAGNESAASAPVVVDVSQPSS
jgi:hypothetical protein